MEVVESREALEKCNDAKRKVILLRLPRRKAAEVQEGVATARTGADTWNGAVLGLALQPRAPQSCPIPSDREIPH